MRSWRCAGGCSPARICRSPTTGSAPSATPRYKIVTEIRELFDGYFAKHRYFGISDGYFRQHLAQLPRVHGLSPGRAGSSYQKVPECSPLGPWAEQTPTPAFAKRGQALVFTQALLHSVGALQLVANQLPILHCTYLTGLGHAPTCPGLAERRRSQPQGLHHVLDGLYSAWVPRDLAHHEHACATHRPGRPCPPAPPHGAMLQRVHGL